MSDHFISIDQAENDLLACAAFLAERIKSSDGHAQAMKSILPRYLALGNVDLAAELANAVEDPFSRDQFLTLVAEKCAELDDNEYALQLAEAIEDHGMQAQAFERVAVVMAGKGDIAGAAGIADTMVHPDFVYAGIAVKQFENGEEISANESLNKIGFPTAQVSALQHIASIRIASKEPEKAAGSLARAIEAAVDIEHDEERIRTICDIANLYIEAGQNDEAIKTFERAREFAEAIDNMHRDFFLTNCALGFLFAGNSELADQTLDLVTDKTQMSSALLGFAREQWAREEKELALDTLDESYAIINSQKESETRDSRSRNSLLASISAQFAGFGKTERGIEIAQQNPDPSEEMAALAQIAQILVVQKEDELARQTVDLIAEDANRLYAILALSDAKDRLGDKAAALELLNEAASLAETVPQLGARSNVLNEIALRLIGHGEKVRAREIFHENLELILQIRDESSRAVELSNLSSVSTRADFELSTEEKAVLERFTRTV